MPAVEIGDVGIDLDHHALSRGGAISMEMLADQCEDLGDVDAFVLDLRHCPLMDASTHTTPG